MMTATLLRRSLVPLAGLTLALFGSALLPSASRAVGFSATFAPANWSLVNATSGVVDETLSSATYTCISGSNDVACVDNLSATSGGVDVVGSVSGQTGGGSSGSPRTTTWTVTNGSAAALLSFDWALTTSPTSGSSVTNQSVSYLVGSSETVLGSTDGNFGSFRGVNSIALAAGQSFGFRVRTTDNTGDFGILSITNFTDLNDVPGPLPLAGGLAAFSWSRRLRRRIGTCTKG